MFFYEHHHPDLYMRHSTVEKARKLACAAHLHRHVEIVIMQKGRTVAYCDSHSFELQDGDVFLSFPEQIHHYISTEPEEYFLLLVNPDTLPELSNFLFDESLGSAALIKGVGKDDTVLRLASRLAECEGASSPLADAERHGLLLALVARLMQQIPPAKAVAGESHALKSIVNYCTQNYLKDLSLTTMEQELHISKYYISHLFSDKLHIGFNDYINSLRVSHACRYLRTTDKSVTEIGNLVGFATLRTFNRAFLKQMKTTPSEYRRSVRADMAIAEMGGEG